MYRERYRYRYARILSVSVIGREQDLPQIPSVSVHA